MRDDQPLDMDAESEANKDGRLLFSVTWASAMWGGRRCALCRPKMLFKAALLGSSSELVI